MAKGISMPRTKIKGAVKSLERRERAVSIPRVTGPMRPKPPKSTREYKKDALRDASEFSGAGFGDTGLTGES
jgi:hypothetical protein